MVVSNVSPFQTKCSFKHTSKISGAKYCWCEVSINRTLNLNKYKQSALHKVCSRDLDKLNLILGHRQFLMLPYVPQKELLTPKMVKSDPKIISLDGFTKVLRGRTLTSNTGTSTIKNGNIVVGTSKTVTSNFKVGN